MRIPAFKEIVVYWKTLTQVNQQGQWLDDKYYVQMNINIYIL